MVMTIQEARKEARRRFGNKASVDVRQGERGTRYVVFLHRSRGYGSTWDEAFTALQAERDGLRVA